MNFDQIKGKLSFEEACKTLIHITELVIDHEFPNEEYEKTIENIENREIELDFCLNRRLQSIKAIYDLLIEYYEQASQKLKDEKRECKSKAYIGDLKHDNIYQSYGMLFRKIKRDEMIKKGAMESWCLGELQPIMNSEPIGQTPSDFRDERDFYNPIPND